MAALGVVIAIGVAGGQALVSERSEANRRLVEDVSVLDSLSLRSETCAPARNCKGGDARAPVLSVERGSERVTGSRGVTGSTLGRNPTGRGSNPRGCTSARRAYRWYVSWEREWRQRMGAGPPGGAQVRRERPDNAPATVGKQPGRSCSWIRRAASLRRARARQARRAYERWFAYAWEAWLPAKFKRVAICETGYNGAPRWDWDSGVYVSAFGIIRSAYRDFAHQLGLRSWDESGIRSPREQYRVAAAIQARYSWNAWGCRNA